MISLWFVRYFGIFSNCPQGGDCDTHLPQVNADAGAVNVALKIVFAIIGAVALIFIMLAGLKFITAQGDPQGVAKARQTIIYALIGLVIALLAEAIVTFVLGKIG